MKILIDTETCQISEKKEDFDSERTEEQLAADYANAISAAMYLKAKQIFDNEYIRMVFMESIFHNAVSWLQKDVYEELKADKKDSPEDNEKEENIDDKIRSFEKS